MPTCPFCAEKIRAAAIVCKHCGRDLPSVRAPADVAFPAGGVGHRSGASARRSPGRWLAAGFAITALALIASNGRLFESSGIRSNGMSLLAPAPTVIQIASAPALEVSAGRAHSWGFEVRDRRTCRLTGHLTGLAGGRKDVKVFLLTADDYANWTQGLKVTRVWDGGQAASRALDAVLPGPGAYRLVVDNTFSVLTDKVVQVDDARVTCR